jgi:hypothetical protein
LLAGKLRSLAISNGHGFFKHANGEAVNFTIIHASSTGPIGWRRQYDTLGES